MSGKIFRGEGGEGERMFDVVVVYNELAQESIKNLENIFFPHKVQKIKYQSFKK